MSKASSFATETTPAQCSSGNTERGIESMRSMFWRIAIAAAVASALLATASVAVAETVVVRPLDMKGWVYDKKSGSNTYMGAQAGFQTAPEGDPLPPGAFFGQTGGGRGTCGQVMIGTNAFNGTLLSSITKLQYTAYTYTRDEVPTDHWEYGSAKPFELQLAIRKDAAANWRYYLYMPSYGASGVTIQYDTWQTFDCMTQGAFYECGSGAATYRTWAQMVAVNPVTCIWPYPQEGYALADAWDTSYGTKSTGTGCALNFSAGYREPNTPFYDMYKQSYNFKGFVDNFTIGVNGVDTVYDFEPRAPVGMSNRATRDTIMNTAREKLVVALWGRVSANNFDLDWPCEFFEIDDGSGLPIKVICGEGCDVGIGNYVSAKGIFNNSVSPPVLYTTYSGITIHQF